MSTLKRFFRDTVIYGIAAVLPRAINILLVKLHTNTLASEKYAENTMYFVYAAYFNALLTYGMETAFFRFFTKEKEKGKVVFTSFISLLITTLSFLVIMLYYSDDISRYFGFSSPSFLKVLLWVTALDTLVVIPYAYLRVSNRPLRFAFYKILNVVIFAGFNLYFLWYVPSSIDSGVFVPEIATTLFDQHPLVYFIFLANLIASCTTFLLLFPLVFKFKIEFDRGMLRRMLTYGLPVMVSSLAFVTNENLDKLILGNLVGKESMGIYAACYKLGVFMTLYITAFKLGAEPFFFNQADKDNAKETYALIMFWFVALGMVFMISIVGFIDLVAQLLLGRSDYFEALAIVPIILLANLMLGIYYNLSVWFKLTDRTRYGMAFSLCGAVITIAVNLALIPVIGYMASAWATLAAYGCMTMLSFVYGKRFYKVPYPVNRIMTMVFLGTVISFLSFYFFRANYIISALGVLTFITGIAWTNKNQIRQLWNR